jgi:glycosyltransferase involved in cell wall biosynthesis
MWFWRRLTSILVERRFDAIHANDLDTLPAGWWAARSTGARLVFDAHEPNYYAYWPAYQYPALAAARQLERSLARRSAHVIVTNSYQTEKYRRMGVSRVTLVANYPLLALVEAARPPDYGDLSEVVLGRIGAIYEDTGVEEIVQAVQMLLERGRKVRLLLAGRLVDSYRARFHALLSPVKDKTDVVGTYMPEQIGDLYQRCHISLQPYQLSPWFRHITPVKFFESIAHGVPVVATDIGGIGDIMRETGCGAVLPSSAPEEIANAVDALISQPAQLQRMSQNGMTAVREKYNWEQMVTALIEVYQNLWDSGPRVAARP